MLIVQGYNFQSPTVPERIVDMRKYIVRILDQQPRGHP